MQLLDYVRLMKETPSYQEGMKDGKMEGRLEGERAIVLRLGTQKFGAPDSVSLAALNGIQSLDRLEDLANRLLIVGNWGDLLA